MSVDIIERRSRLGVPSPLRSFVPISRIPKPVVAPVEPTVAAEPAASTFALSVPEAPLLPMMPLKFKILRYGALAFGMPKEDIVGKGKFAGRFAHMAWARQCVCWAMRTHSAMSYPSIARTLGNRDHTTMMAGYNVVESAISQLGIDVGDSYETALVALAVYDTNPLNKNYRGGLKRSVPRIASVSENAGAGE